ncbi:Hypothetical_protein [Hexamita inflata]|uniref:Hypothetical_protein n=1 Tax=Hexamita inflata TaxID=28002 RepID=A0AA86QQQ5_9EUKA|nr:Hypothetical protein HINF_LOCUS45039 [Hexamita inflata]
MLNSGQMGQFAVVDLQNGQIHRRLNQNYVQTIPNESVFVRFKVFASPQQLYVFAIVNSQLLCDLFCELNVKQLFVVSNIQCIVNCFINVFCSHLLIVSYKAHQLGCLVICAVGTENILEICLSRLLLILQLKIIANEIVSKNQITFQGFKGYYWLHEHDFVRMQVQIGQIKFFKCTYSADDVILQINGFQISQSCQLTYISDAIA